jgi:hypothetical protein
MAANDVFSSVLELPFGPIFQTLLPDFVLAFAFFTALSYAVLARRFEHQRSAIVMSAAVGIALAIGLVWWEQEQGWSVRNLGPVAVGFTVILLAMILFQGTRQMGGSWAGAAIAFGASLLIAGVLGLPWASGTFQALALLALIVGVVMFVLHMHRGATHIHPLPKAAVLQVDAVRHDMGDLYEDEHVGDRLQKRLGLLRDEARHVEDHPQQASELMEQLRRILPAEGWLTERLAQLRARAHLIREGHIHQLQELQQFATILSPEARKTVASELTSGYQAIVGIDERIERLDNAVAENERRIRDVTSQAREALARYDYARLRDLLDTADKLQRHNQKLLRNIEHTEKKLTCLVETVAKRAAQMSQG